MIPFNVPFVTGKEIEFINEAVTSKKHTSGNGYFTKKCQSFFEERYGFKRCLLTTSCTDALEMSALLIDVCPGDEIIVPSYTFVSSALAFVRQGAKIVFVDSKSDHPGLDETRLKELITPKTKAIVVVHYAGMACDMDAIMDLANKHNIFVIEDAAQAFDSYYKDKPLGGIGHLGCFSFHETKNIQCGEGGMLVINDDRFIKRAEIIWEKGTNRSEFFRGEVNKYGWVDIGSSFLMSDILAAFLWAQLENHEEIQKRRKVIWDWYDKHITTILQNFDFEKVNYQEYATNNAHTYFIVAKDLQERTKIMAYLKGLGLSSVFHYICLHSSSFYSSKFGDSKLPMAEKFENCLLRFPLYPTLDCDHLNVILLQNKLLQLNQD